MSRIDFSQFPSLNQPTQNSSSGILNTLSSGLNSQALIKEKLATEEAQIKRTNEDIIKFSGVIEQYIALNDTISKFSENDAIESLKRRSLKLSPANQSAVTVEIEEGSNLGTTEIKEIKLAKSGYITSNKKFKNPNDTFNEDICKFQIVKPINFKGLEPWSNSLKGELGNSIVKDIILNAPIYGGDFVSCIPSNQSLVIKFGEQELRSEPIDLEKREIKFENSIKIFLNHESSSLSDLAAKITQDLQDSALLAFSRPPLNKKGALGDLQIPQQGENDKITTIGAFYISPSLYQKKGEIKLAINGVDFIAKGLDDWIENDITLYSENQIVKLVVNHPLNITNLSSAQSSAQALNDGLGVTCSQDINLPPQSSVEDLLAALKLVKEIKIDAKTQMVNNKNFIIKISTAESGLDSSILINGKGEELFKSFLGQDSSAIINDIAIESNSNILRSGGLKIKLLNENTDTVRIDNDFDKSDLIESINNIAKNFNSLKDLLTEKKKELKGYFISGKLNNEKGGDGRDLDRMIKFIEGATYELSTLLVESDYSNSLGLSLKNNYLLFDNKKVLASDLSELTEPVTKIYSGIKNITSRYTQGNGLVSSQINDLRQQIDTYEQRMENQLRFYKRKQEELAMRYGAMEESLIKTNSALKMLEDHKKAWYKD